MNAIFGLHILFDFGFFLSLYKCHLVERFDIFHVFHNIGNVIFGDLQEHEIPGTTSLSLSDSE